VGEFFAGSDLGKGLGTVVMGADMAGAPVRGSLVRWIPRRRRGFAMCTESPEQCGGCDGRPRVLVVDEAYDVEEAVNGAEALIRLRNETFAAIILDKNMPGLSGLDILPGLRKICPETPVILITAFGDVSTYVEAMEKGAYEYVFKPFRMEELVRVLKRARPSEPKLVPPQLTQGATS
jgi:CheY-like chemotaxis protein